MGVLRETRAEFADDRVPLRSAALAYYTAFSIAPLLVIAIATAGWLFGEDAARGRIQSTIAGLVGEESANAIEQMIQGARRPREGLVATVIGVVALLFGASGVFGQLKDSIDAIWEVAPAKGKTFLRAIHDRFLSFAMVFGIGFLLLVSLLLSAALAALGGSLRGSLPGGTAAWHGLDMVASFALVTLLFALLFKFVPDARISWRDARIGAATTAFLFEIGKFAIGQYLGRSSFSSVYGAIGSFLVVLLWVYYSSLILFAGAEFTQCYANRLGSRVTPKTGAVRRPKLRSRRLDLAADPRGAGLEGPRGRVEGEPRLV